MTNHPTSLEAKLFNKPAQALSELEIKILFEQYKLFVETQETVGERRHNPNKFFLTINTALVTAVTGFINLTPQAYLQYGWIIGAAIAGLVLCFVWRRLIESYRQLNTGKFKVIHLLEANLPARLFDAEWDALGQGKDEKMYQPFTYIEERVPLIFGFIYSLIGLFSIWSMLAGLN